MTIGIQVLKLNNANAKQNSVRFEKTNEIVF